MALARGRRLEARFSHSSDADSRPHLSLPTAPPHPQSAARSAVDEIASIDQELPLLRHRAAQQAAAAAATSASSSSRAAASSSSAATAIDDARMSPTERQRAAAAAYAAAGPPPDDPSINPARKGLVRAAASVVRRLCGSIENGWGQGTAAATRSPPSPSLRSSLPLTAGGDAHCAHVRGHPRGGQGGRLHVLAPAANHELRAYATMGME